MSVKSTLFTPLHPPQCETHIPGQLSHYVTPEPSTALYYSNFWRFVITPIAWAALPLVALITLVSAAVYCFFSGHTIQELLAKTLGLPALSMDPKIRAEIRAEVKDQISTTTKDGVQLNGVQIFQGSSNWIVAMNGNTGSWEKNHESLKRMTEQQKANVVSFNYRGVGASSGYCRSSDDLICDGIAMVQKLLDHGVNPNNIVIYGHSLGGGVGAQVMVHFLQRNIQIRRFISDRSFETLREAVKAFFWIPIYRDIIACIVDQWWKLDSYSAVKKIKNRTKIIFASKDYIIANNVSLYHSFKKRNEEPPHTLILIDQIDDEDSFCFVSRCAQLGRSHIWDIPDTHSQVKKLTGFEGEYFFN